MRGGVWGGGSAPPQQTFGKFDQIHRLLVQKSTRFVDCLSNEPCWFLHQQPVSRQKLAIVRPSPISKGWYGYLANLLNGSDFLKKYHSSGWHGYLANCTKSAKSPLHGRQKFTRAKSQKSPKNFRHLPLKFPSITFRRGLGKNSSFWKNAEILKLPTVIFKNYRLSMISDLRTLFASLMYNTIFQNKCTLKTRG